MSALSLPPERRPSVVLHVGMGKTGTTTIQATFHRNRRRLARQGVVYPGTPGKRRHTRLGLAMQADDGVERTSVGWRRQEVSTPGELRPIVEQALFAELERKGPRHVVFSDEALFGSTDEGLANLRDLLDRMASGVRVVAYLRRQDDHLCSRYQQVVKREGETRLLTERAQMDLAHIYDYHDRLTSWRDLVRPDRLVVRAFHPPAFLDGSLLSDFVDATGLGLDPESLDQVPPRNESVDAETAEVLRILNLHLRDLGTPAVRAVTNDLMQRLRPHTSGLTLTLPEDALDGFMDRWEASNDAVARDFRDGEALFPFPRKARGTTTTQRLPPGRFAELLEHTEVPEDWRPNLLRVAEREAAR